MLSDTLQDELRKNIRDFSQDSHCLCSVVGRCHGMTWTQQGSHHRHTCSGSLIKMNNNIPVTSKDLSAEKLGTAFFWDMAQRDVPEERDPHDYPVLCRMRLKCDGTRAETRFRLSPKRTSPFKSAGALVQSSTGSRGVRISGSNAGYTTFRGSVKSTGYPLHSPVSFSLPLPFITVCHDISTGL